MRNLTFTARLSGIRTLAKTLAVKTRGGEVFALIGPLGAGKTGFAKIFCKLLNVRSNITSPTFTIVREYQGKAIQSKKPLRVYHLDLYRVTNFHELENTGIIEVWGTPGTVTLIEWADKIAEQLPKKVITITFEHEDTFTV